MSDKQETSDESSAPRFFPPPSEASPDGIVCLGGPLVPEVLLDAYRHGIFPWPEVDENRRVWLIWCSPDPRAIFKMDGLHISQRLRRTLRAGKFQVTCDQDFEGVMRGCATTAGRADATWITPAMIEAYCQMHELGYAHSVEVWQDDELVGGVYGLAIGGLFAAESMFYRVRDASKVALVHLVAHLGSRGYQLFDIQQWTPHTGSLGAVEVCRSEYLDRLAKAVDLPVTFGSNLEGNLLGLVAR
jgi:leucyl/phenylalanyl-tRNA---protein transferase